MAAPVIDLQTAAARARLPSQISAVEEAIATTVADAGAAREQAVTSVVKTQELTDTITKSLNENTVNKQTQARAVLNGQLAAENANTAVLTAAGGTEAQVQLMTELTLQNEELNILSDEKLAIMHREHTGIGAVDFIINSIGSIGNSIETQQIAVARNQTANQIASVNSGVESFARVNNATKTTLNEGAIEANMAEIGDINTIAASEKEIANVHNNASAMNNLLKVDNQVVAARVQNVSLSQQVEQQAIARTRAQLQIEQLNFQREKFKVQLPTLRVQLEAQRLQLEENKFVTDARRQAHVAKFDETTRQVAEMVRLQEQQVLMIQRGQSALSGEAGVEPKETIIRGINSGGAVGAGYEKFRNIGARPEVSFGGSASEANTTLTQLDPDSAAPQTKGLALIYQMRQKYAADIQASAAKGLPVPKTAEAFSAGFDAVAKQTMDTFASNIVTGQTNPYAAPPMESLAPFLEGKGIALYDKVLKVKGLTEVDPQTILDSAIQGVQSGTISMPEAAEGIVQLFNVVADFNNINQGGLARYGLPAQDTFNTSVLRPRNLAAAPSGILGLSAPRGLGQGPSAQPDTGGGFTSAGEVFGQAKLAAQNFFLDTPTEIIDVMDVVEVQDTLVRMRTFGKSPKPATPQTTPNSPPPKEVPTASASQGAN
jgi:hypothetical protein